MAWYLYSACDDLSAMYKCLLFPATPSSATSNRRGFAGFARTSRCADQGADDFSTADNFE